MQNKLQTLVNIASSGLFYLRWVPEGDFVFEIVNPSGEHIAAAQHLEGKLMCEAVPGHHTPLPAEGGLSTYEIYRRVAFREPPYESGHRKARLEFNSPHFGGKAWFDQTVRQVKPGEIVIDCSDVTKDVQRQQELYDMAMLDTVCSLPDSPIYTRLYFYSQLNDAVIAWKKRSVVSTLIAFDLDKFKSVNDTRGHLAGDAVLQTVAQRAAAIVPKGCPVGRPSGDEYWILLWGVDLDRGFRIGQEVCTAISEPINWTDPEDNTQYALSVTASIGMEAVCDV